MRFLLTSSGIKNTSIQNALVNLLGKPIAESSALCIPTAMHAMPGGAGHAWRFISGRATTPLCERAASTDLPLVSRRGIMPARAEVLGTLAASQTQVTAFFQGLSPQDLERPATASGVPGATPWRAKDHLTHLVTSERRIQHLLRQALVGDTRDVLLRRQYPEGMPLPSILGDLSAPTPEEVEWLEIAVANVNQTDVNTHHDDSVEMLAADYLAARRDTITTV